MKFKDLRKLSKLSGEQIAAIMIGEAEVARVYAGVGDVMMPVSLYPELDDAYYDKIGAAIENIFAKGMGKIADNNKPDPISDLINQLKDLGFSGWGIGPSPSDSRKNTQDTNEDLSEAFKILANLKGLVPTKLIQKKILQSDIKGRAKRIIKNYIEMVKVRRAELGFKAIQTRFKDSHKIIKREEVENIEKIASAKGRRELFWYGIVYEMISPFGAKYGGLTITSLSFRWKYAVMNALKDLTNNRDFDKEIRKVLFDDGALDVSEFKKNRDINGAWDWGKIFGKLNKLFTRKVVRVAFSQRSLLKAEREFIREFNLISDGLNMQEGGSLGRKKIDLPMLFIAQYIAMGYNIKQITEELHRRGYIVTEHTVGNRIKQFFGSFQEAQILFLRDLLEELVKESYELYEINNAFDRFMLDRIKAFFGGKSYSELLEIIDQDWSQLEITRTEVSGYYVHEGLFDHILPLMSIFYILDHYNTLTSASRSNYIKNIFPNLHKVDSIRRILSDNIRYQIGFDEWKACKNYYLAPYIIEEYRSWDESTEPIINLGGRIWQRYGYSAQRSRKNHNDYSKKFFNGLNTREACDFLKEHPTITDLIEFRRVFFAEKGRSDVKKFSKAEIDNNLLKYADHNKAAKELEILTSDLMEQVKVYYNSWDDGRKQVVVLALIRLFRACESNPSAQKIYEIFKSVGYTEQSSISHNRLTKRLFKGKFSTTKDAILFFKSHPNINTYEEVNVYFSRSKIGSGMDHFL